MMICKTCNGLGFDFDDVCLDCDGEGVLDNRLSESAKVHSNKKPLSYTEYEKKEQRNYKFDKKNAQRF